MILFNFTKNLYFYLFIFLFIFFYYNKSLSKELNDLQWKISAGNNYSHRFFSGNQINKNNIKHLSKLWTFNSGSTSKSQTVQSSPIFIGDQLLLVTLAGELVSLSPINGQLLWKKKLDKPLGARGFTYHESRDADISGIYIASGKKIVQLNKEGIVKNYFLTETSLLQPFLDEKNLYVATLKHGVQAFDLKTKNKIWSTSLFKDNVNADYLTHTLFSDLLSYSNSNAKLIASGNVKGESIEKGEFIADSVEYSLKNKTLDLSMFDNKQVKVKIKN